MKKVTMIIEGMHCASCASNVEKSFTKMGGAKNIRINVLMKKGYADVDDKITDQDIKQAVKKAGYTATQITFENA